MLAQPSPHKYSAEYCKYKTTDPYSFKYGMQLYETNKHLMQCLVMPSQAAVSSTASNTWPGKAAVRTTNNNKEIKPETNRNTHQYQLIDTGKDTQRPNHCCVRCRRSKYYSGRLSTTEIFLHLSGTSR